MIIVNVFQLPIKFCFKSSFIPSLQTVSTVLHNVCSPTNFTSSLQSCQWSEYIWSESPIKIQTMTRYGTWRLHRHAQMITEKRHTAFCDTILTCLIKLFVFICMCIFEHTQSYLHVNTVDPDWIYGVGRLVCVIQSAGKTLWFVYNLGNYIIKVARPPTPTLNICMCCGLKQNNMN